MNGFVVLISGRGSNLKAICDAGLTTKIKCVISNKAEAKGLDYAKQLGLTTAVIEHKLFSSREEFDHAVAKEIDKHGAELIVLAGFMRILSPWFIKYYNNKIINIHPSLLPSFIGANAQADAIFAKVKVSGATVHLVTNQLDHGPILAQGVISAYQDLNNSDLADRILKLEHVLYPFVIRKFLLNQVKVSNDGTITIESDEKDRALLKEYVNHIFY